MFRITASALRLTPMTAEWREFFVSLKPVPCVSLFSLHLLFIYSCYIVVVAAKWETIVIMVILAHLTGMGVLVGAHRYFTHQSFKAKLPLRIILMLLQTLAGQKNIVEWVTDHRLHHKYTDTDADVVNHKRGFFFAHMGWLLMYSRPECYAKRKLIDISDLLADPVVRFQRKHYPWLVFLVHIVIPTILPYYLCGETLVNGFLICFVFRYVYTLHVAFSGNSVAHLWGTKPYDQSMSAVHNEPLIYATQGGAYHNFHHVFPWDYSESEFGLRGCFNMPTAFIDLFALIGWAYDRKKAPQEMVDTRRQRTGDGLPCANPVRRFPLMDWIFGLVFVSNVLLVVFPLRYFFYRNILDS